jgi:hypothetical protein
MGSQIRARRVMIIIADTDSTYIRCIGGIVRFGIDALNLDNTWTIQSLRGKTYREKLSGKGECALLDRIRLER